MAKRACSVGMDAGRWGVALVCALAAGALGAPLARATDLAPCVPDGPVYAITHANGNTYIGGNFDAVGQRSGPGVPLADASASGGGSPPACQVGSDPESAGGSPTSGQPIRSFPEVAGGKVYAAVSDQNGGWYIAGTFTSVADQPRGRIAHILSDGTLDSVGAGINAINCTNITGCAVYALTLDPDPTQHVLYAGGNFAGLGGSSGDANLVPIDTDNGGLVNESAAATNWAPPTPAGTVYALQAVPVSIDVSTTGGPSANSTKMSILIVGGNFTTLGAQVSSSTPSVPNLGALWGVGATQSCGGSNGLPSCPAGSATLMGGNNLANAVGPSASNVWKPSPSSAVNTVVVGQPVATSGSNAPCSSTAVCTEYMPVYAGVTCSTGSTCSSPLLAYQLPLITQSPSPYSSSNVPGESPGFGSPTSLWNWGASGANSISVNGSDPETVSALAVWPPPSFGNLPTTASPSTVYFGGDFSAQLNNGSPPATATDLAAASGITNPAATSPTNGALVSSWAPAQVNAPVNALTVAPGPGSSETVYAGGGFTTPGSHAAAFDGSSGALLSNWTPALAGGEVDALAWGNYGSTPAVYAGGGFESTGAQPRSNLAAFDSSGNLLNWSPDASIGSKPAACVGSATSPDAQVDALAASGSTIYVGGLFDTPACNLMAVDASSGAVSNFSADGVVRALASTGTALYAGGDFTHIGGLARNGLAKLDPSSGAADPNWNPNPGTGTDGYTSVSAINASCSTVYVGGDFASLGGKTRNDLGALDPASGAPTNWNPGPDSYVYAIQRTGNIVYVAGNFSNVGFGGGPRVAALDAGTGRASTNFYAAPVQTLNALALAGSTIYEGQSDAAAQADPPVDNLIAVQGNPSATDSFGNSTWGQPLDPGLLASGNGTTTDAEVDPYTSDPAHTPIPDGDVLALSAYGSTLYVGGDFMNLGTRPQEGYAAIPLATDVGSGATNCPGASPPAPAVQISGSGAFGNQAVGTTSAPHAITITNSGGAPLVLPASGVALTGSDSGQYVETSDGCSGLTIAAGGSCTVHIAFAPSKAGPHNNAALQFSDNAVDAPQAVALSGSGVATSGLPPGPDLTDLKQSHRDWREPPAPSRSHRRKRADHASKHRPQPPVGTTFSFTLTQSARVRFVFTQVLPGRMVGGRCVAPSNRNRRHRACERTSTAGSWVVSAKSGSNHRYFDGRLSRSRWLPVGAYTALVIATDAGQSSAPKRLVFTIEPGTPAAAHCPRAKTSRRRGSGACARKARG